MERARSPFYSRKLHVTDVGTVVMEALYLLCSVLSVLFKSLIFSAFLPYRSIFRRLCTLLVGGSGGGEAESLYVGTVWHERRHPVHHAFRHSVRYALVDLDHPSYSLSNHLSADEARRIAGTNGSVFLLTIPPSVGYEQNPFSLYYCYDIEESGRSLKKCIAEVTNTPWGESVSFLFNPNSDLVAKALFVSPFMDMLGNWSIRASAPGDDISVAIVVHHPQFGNFFSANLTAKRIPSSSIDDHALFFWLMPHKVAVWIYWHALMLWWKDVPIIQHPKYHCPEYREEVKMRDEKLKGCRAFAEDMQDHLPIAKADSDGVRGMSEGNRWIKWRDAKWPWS